MNSSCPRLRIWDLPTRLFHVAFALTVTGAIACAKLGSGLMTWHVRLGIVALALLVFRVIWGLVGPRTARFSQFVVSPTRAWHYLRHESSAHGAYAGHNPAGGWAVVALLAAVALAVSTGYLNYQDDSAEFWSELHELAGNGIMVLVGLHVAAVIATSLLHRENLVRAMVNGYKRARSGEGVDGGDVAAPGL